MKKNVFVKRLLLATMMCAPFTASAQVTIGSDALPQATLDIIGDTLTAHGEAFRLIDGNQVPGKVLTCDENGIGSWQKSGITILDAALDRMRISPTFGFSDYPNSSSMYVDYDSYLDLEPGKYLIVSYIPIFFDFQVPAFENVAYHMGLTKNGSTLIGDNTQIIDGPLRANVMTRNVNISTINTSGDSSTTRYYVCYNQFSHIDATGNKVNQTGTVNLYGGVVDGNLGGRLLAIPLVQ